MQRAKYLTNERIRGAFNYLDTNHDGYISRDDLILKGVEDDVNDYFKDLPVDCDKIDFERFKMIVSEKDK